MSKLNSCKDTAMNNEELLEYENEVLVKIKKDDLFSQINNNHEDGLGNFIDRIIYSSFKINKNK